MWALRIIAHTADVLNFCYSDECRNLSCVGRSEAVLRYLVLI